MSQNRPSKPRCIQLVGVPGSGKTSWTRTQTLIQDAVVISTDHYVEWLAAERGVRYDDVFSEAMPAALHYMMREVRRAQSEGRDIIWDQTSTTRVARQRKFRALPEYEHIAVVLSLPEVGEHRRRLRVREETGKTVSLEDIMEMVRLYEEPTVQEGFSKIIHVD
jgi:predicted kinase